MFTSMLTYFYHKLQPSWFYIHLVIYTFSFSPINGDSSKHIKDIHKLLLVYKFKVIIQMSNIYLVQCISIMPQSDFPAGGHRPVVIGCVSDAPTSVLIGHVCLNKSITTTDIVRAYPCRRL